MFLCRRHEATTLHYSSINTHNDNSPLLFPKNEQNNFLKDNKTFKRAIV